MKSIKLRRSQLINDNPMDCEKQKIPFMSKCINSNRDYLSYRKCTNYLKSHNDYLKKLSNNYLIKKMIDFNKIAYLKSKI
ncbi:hypothetical protein BpHYR1_006898 [Brachionus plicatilis]|uniref:Uncharacterized protein n=1 Tax=Brachionus plicatilis TaxID=10195 RepID=A0A3M7RWD3_BRAPC|nr:hypothetical protein BpHYR1_006898 [Brachionus plicatilis]